MTRMPKESRYSAFVFERRLLMGFMGFTVLGTIIWVVSLITEYWYVVDAPHGIYDEANNDYFIRENGGLFRVCRLGMKNGSVMDTNSMFLSTICEYRKIFASDSEEPDMNDRVIMFARTEIAFGAISLLLMVMALGFSAYTFRETRYMYKRLASGVLLISAAVVMVVIKVLVNRVTLEHTSIADSSTMYYGYSFAGAWVSFIAYVSSGLVFMACSRKKKRDKAPTEAIALADEPNIISR